MSEIWKKNLKFCNFFLKFFVLFFFVLINVFFKKNFSSSYDVNWTPAIFKMLDYINHVRKPFDPSNIIFQ